jgi:2-C-methyl-D-erythritol 4-phosphate cytidylyltransferase
LAVALILAAGRGERLGAECPKALVELAGKPLLQWSIEVLSGVPAIERIVVALPPGTGESPGMDESLRGSLGLGGSLGLLDPEGDAGGVIAVEGGSVRSESVRLALAAAGGGVTEGGAAGDGALDLVLVHDAARPLLTRELVQDTLAAVQGENVDAAIAAAPVTDTVKRAEDGVVSETLDRSQLWAVQTPQVFRRASLERALDVSQDVLAQATDDAWLIERAGGTVVVVPAPPHNLKITTSLDLALAEMLLASRPA